MKSNFAIGGHPLHPMLVGLPIGLFIWTFVADIVYAVVMEQTWYDIAFWSGIAAGASALIAALPGFGDYLTLPLRVPTRSQATVHMLLNLTIVALYGVAAYVMAVNEPLEGAALTWTLVLHGVGVGLLVVSGWLGAGLVYKHRIGVIEDPTEAARAERQTEGVLRR